MSEPFLGEIRIVGFNFAPRGWAFCDGQILPINTNQSLYSLLGTTYGGDGRTSFALPDLRGRTPFHVGDGYSLGQKGGAETVTLNVNELGAHNHALKGSSAPADKWAPAANRTLATGTDATDPLYKVSGSLTGMNSGVVTHVGGSQAHNNMQPSLVVSFCIALLGLFPSRN
jgi:microcystin-dependent protein